jgi:hypothetical protein
LQRLLADDSPPTIAALTAAVDVTVARADQNDVAVGAVDQMNAAGTSIVRFLVTVNLADRDVRLPGLRPAANGRDRDAMGLPAGVG